uniref:Globin family profile domain-containing protein n=1 Tax=Parascaris equorum TaxID=6256 RepID=A0A914REN7_PAREQ
FSLLSVIAVNYTFIYCGLARSTVSARYSRIYSCKLKADTAAVFAQSDVDCSKMHTRLTLELIDNVVKNLDQSPDRFIDYLLEVGHCHRHLKAEGLGQAAWDDLGDALLDSARKFDLVRKHKELRRAWLALVAFLIDHLKQGHTSFRSSRYLSFHSNKV